MKNLKWSCLLALGAAIWPFAGSLSTQAAETARIPPLVLYGVEMERRPEILPYEFEEIAKKNPKASSLLWKFDRVTYAGEGEIVLSGYSPDRKEAEKIARSVPGSKILEITVLPREEWSGREVAVYGFPLAGSEDSVVGDVWVVSRGQAPRRLVENVLLGYVHPENTTVFKVAGFSKDEASFVYCLGPCTRYDVETGKKTGVDASAK
ncbi:MAG TPA: hypothetical protein VLJ37_01655 [bacterium]|nr:hypothetical protein [bacterium]